MGTVETPHHRGGTAHDEGVGPAPVPPNAPRTTTPSRREEIPLDAAQEDALRARLETDPNDEPAFRQLADLVRRGAAEGHEGGDPQKAADDSVWSLAEEMARSPRAWYPLVELARLSLPEDRDGALRRLAIASDRDHTGRALAEGLNVLRDAGLPDEALGLGVGHWRPRDHDPDAGRHLVHAAVEAGRIGEARRHLAAFEQFPDQARVIDVRTELERTIEAAAAARLRPTR